MIKTKQKEGNVMKPWKRTRTKIRKQKEIVNNRKKKAKQDEEEEDDDEVE